MIAGILDPGTWWRRGGSYSRNTGKLSSGKVLGDCGDGIPGRKNAEVQPPNRTGMLVEDPWSMSY